MLKFIIFQYTQIIANESIKSGIQYSGIQYICKIEQNRTLAKILSFLQTYDLIDALRTHTYTKLV